jgi:UDP:flavonoid glycosyltransferase YjiC (YdhE family)
VKIIFASLGAYGHLYPMMPLALACADAGHEVVVATGEPFLGRLPLPTVPGNPDTLELDWSIQETRRRHPDLHGQEFGMTMFGADQPRAAAAATPRRLRNSVDSDPIRCLQRLQRRRTGMAHCGTQQTRVYLTLGTVSYGAVEVLNRAIADIAPLDVDILVTVGPDGEPAVLGEVPDNVHIERFVAQSAVLPLVDLIVHHGGTGTVLGALEIGLPQLVLPQGADQFLNAEVLTAAGIGRALANDAQRPGAISEAVQALLGDSAERQAACRVRDEIAAMPSPSEVVPQLVELANRAA